MDKPILWMGKEEEGSTLKGTLTLFIGSDSITVDDIKDIIVNNSIEQLYFGAGGCTKINQSVIEYFINTNSFIITIEMALEDVDNYNINFLNKVNLIITHNNVFYGNLTKLNKNTTQLKLQSLFVNPILVVFDLKDGSETDLERLKGITYINDIVLK